MRVKSLQARGLHHEAAVAADIEESAAVHMLPQLMNTVARPPHFRVYFGEVVCRRTVIGIIVQTGQLRRRWQLGHVDDTAVVATDERHPIMNRKGFGFAAEAGGARVVGLIRQYEPHSPEITRWPAQHIRRQRCGARANKEPSAASLKFRISASPTFRT
jgi:hypothetical protein